VPAVREAISSVPPFRVGHVVFREPLAYHLGGHCRGMPRLGGTIVEGEIQNPSWWEDRTEVCADAGDVLPDADGNLLRDTDVEAPVCGACFSRPLHRVLESELCSGSVVCSGTVRTLEDVDSIGASTPVDEPSAFGKHGAETGVHLEWVDIYAFAVVALRNLFDDGRHMPAEGRLTPGMNTAETILPYRHT
jgi:hypothetical protein